MKFIPLLLAAALFLTPALLRAQGKFPPEFAPNVPLMKTLTQVEPRTPIPATTAAPAAGPFFIIGTSGSYYLTGNVTVTSGDAILITADGVTLDLNGFSLLSTSAAAAGSGTAVSIDGARERITVRNGSISNTGAATGGFANGVRSNLTVTKAIVSDLTISKVATTGIYLNAESIVERCVVNKGAGAGRGIQAETVLNCVATSANDDGIYANGNVSNCAGSTSSGIGITAFGNVTNSSGQSSSGFGIFASGNITNSSGNGTSYGIFSNVNITNSAGRGSGVGGSGITCVGTASYCRGTGVSGASAITAAIAIGCTSGGGTINSPQKHLGTP